MAIEKVLVNGVELDAIAYEGDKYFFVELLDPMDVDTIDAIVESTIDGATTNVAKLKASTLPNGVNADVLFSGLALTAAEFGYRKSFARARDNFPEAIIGLEEEVASLQATVA